LEHHSCLLGLQMAVTPATRAARVFHAWPQISLPCMISPHVFFLQNFYLMTPFNWWSE
jgi:hypothetical protein